MPGSACRLPATSTGPAAGAGGPFTAAFSPCPAGALRGSKRCSPRPSRAPRSQGHVPASRKPQVFLLTDPQGYPKERGKPGGRSRGLILHRIGPPGRLKSTGSSAARQIDITSQKQPRLIPPLSQPHILGTCSTTTKIYIFAWHLCCHMKCFWQPKDEERQGLVPPCQQVTLFIRH